MEEFELPEIKRVDLCSTVLELHAWGRPDVRGFGWYEPPDDAMLESAESLAAMLGAIDASGKITRIGRQLATLPVHPRLGRLLAEAAGQNLPREGALLAALMSEKDIMRGGPMQSRDSLAAGAGRMSGVSDLLMRMHLLESNPRDDRLDRQAVKQVIRVRDELMRLGVQGSEFKVQEGEDALLRMVLLAYPDRVCRRRGGADRAVMVGGGGVKLSPESVVRQGEFFVVVDARQDDRSQSREAFVRIASRIDREWLEELFPSQIRKAQAVQYDDQRQRVVAATRVFYRDLLLHEDKDAPVDPAKARELFAQIVRERAATIFRENDDAQSMINRVTLLREKMPEHAWPAWDDAQLGDILADSVGGASTLAAVKNLPLAGILRSSLHYPLDRLLDKESPETLLVPSGNQIRLRYSPGEVVLAVRLQELFGLHDTPRIAGGRVPLKLELLAPNFRPVQITTDLRSFWTNTYAQVKKDLKARYPKHSWPDDPWTAKAEAKGGRRRG
jgi:ATP-dependent helicase HrpB